MFQIDPRRPASEALIIKCLRNKALSIPPVLVDFHRGRSILLVLGWYTFTEAGPFPLFWYTCTEIGPFPYSPCPPLNTRAGETLLKSVIMEVRCDLIRGRSIPLVLPCTPSENQLSFPLLHLQSWRGLLEECYNGGGM